ncbi:hypothetical protein [Rhodalgimonas zhirmunskyi]|uniref:Glycosyltransferase n=1 Tax=Rhodalgimonas zhirmunskyi TaxID=2964767 RepID=A0AAJ1U7P7_9RHOB|nr:hypothetical protein [Rhodoalgimonas zhirmunskyi]MDQ2094430.1 hypothetical protein [Rhodoalgimonas zhirmunskyi]
MTEARTAPRTVICMKWGTLYSAAYVNVLYNACRAHITGDFRFVCLTDDASGFLPEVEHFPIPDMGLSEFDWKKGGWAKLSVFKEELYDITGRCLFLDLDSVVTGSLDEMFDYPGDVVVIDSSENWRGGTGAAPSAMTSVFAFTVGQHPEVYERFMADHAGMVSKYRIEQVYLQGEITEGGLAFWPREWLVSFKWHLRRPALVGLVLPPRAAPDSCRVIAFHGDPRPIDLVRPGMWGIGPHWGRGSVPWAVDYWRSNGGDPGRD